MHSLEGPRSRSFAFERVVAQLQFLMRDAPVVLPQIPLLHPGVHRGSSCRALRWSARQKQTCLCGAPFGWTCIVVHIFRQRYVTHSRRREAVDGVSWLSRPSFSPRRSRSSTGSLYRFSSCLRQDCDICLCLVVECSWCVQRIGSWQFCASLLDLPAVASIR